MHDSYQQNGIYFIMHLYITEKLLFHGCKLFSVFFWGEGAADRCRSKVQFNLNALITMKPIRRNERSACLLKHKNITCLTKT